MAQMDAKARKKLTIQIAAGVLIVLILAVVGFMIFGGSEEVEETNNLGPSDSMIPADPSVVAAQNVATLTASPSTVNLNAQITAQIFTLMANGGPVVIEDARLPAEYSADLQITSVDCPLAPSALTAGGSCNVNVVWNGQRDIATTIEVVARTAASTASDIQLVIPVTTQGGNPEAVSGAPLDLGAIPNQGAGSSVPQEASYQAPPQITQGQVVTGQPQVAQPSLRQQQRNAYLEARRGTSLTGVAPNQLNPSAKSPYTSWNNVGARGTVSSYPTDMSRVITPDKAITAVIVNAIDTRMPVTAVAMVDRDVYGNNGRTVVIPRGSKLIGQIGASEERVGIAWNQLIRPDGVRFVFDGASGDAMGRGGIPGRVNERLLRRYGFSILPTAVAAGITAALGGNQATTIGGAGGAIGATGGVQVRDAKSVAAEILTQPLNQIAQDLYERNSNIPVQITVPAGTRITIWSTEDLRLKPVGERDSQEQTASNRQAYGGNANVNLPGGQQQQQQQQNGNQFSNQSQQNTGAQQDPNMDSNVGGIDANGNYIGPGALAPNPGQQGVTRRTAPSSPTRNNGQTSFPSTSNPWQR